MLNAFQIIFWGVLTFSILVVMHEGGHFLAARAFGVKVHEFMVGLPGPRISIETKRHTLRHHRDSARWLRAHRRHGARCRGRPSRARTSDGSQRRPNGRRPARRSTRDRHRPSGALLYTLADWGAIKPAANDKVSYVPVIDGRDSETPASLLDRARATTYRGLKTWKRIVLLASGVVVNLVTAIVVFTIVLSIWGYYEQSLTLEDVVPGGAAAQAGMRCRRHPDRNRQQASQRLVRTHTGACRAPSG